MTKKTVKARGRRGTATMDLSIPAEVSREYDIDAGDVFAVDVTTDEASQLVIRYTRVYDGE